MNINSSSNGLSWAAPVPHLIILFVCLFVSCSFFVFLFFVLFFLSLFFRVFFSSVFSFSFSFFCLSEEVFLHVTQLFTNLVWCSNAHTAVASFSCDILPQLALSLVGHFAV